MKILTIIFLFYSFAYGACCEVPCPSSIADGFEQGAEQALEQNYKQVKNALEDVKKEYDELLKNLKTSNEKLKTAIKLNKAKLLREKEIVFLLKQHNELQGIQNNIRTIDE